MRRWATLRHARLTLCAVYCHTSWKEILYPVRCVGIKREPIITCRRVQILFDTYSVYNGLQGIQWHVGDSCLFDTRRHPLLCTKTDKNSGKPALR